MKIIAVVIFFTTIVVSSPAADEHGFQRYAPVIDRHELIIEGIFGYLTQSAGTRESYLIQPQLAAEYVIDRHTAKLEFPYVFIMHNNPQIEKRFLHGAADMIFTYEYWKQVRNLNLFFGGFWGIPIPQNDDDSGIGSGRHNLGITFSLTGITDPVVWNVTIRYWIGLPKEEQMRRSWQPANTQANAGFTVMFNTSLGLSLNLFQTLSFPQINDSVATIRDFNTQTLFRPEIFVMGDEWHIRVGIGIHGHPAGMPFLLNFTYGRIINFRP